MIMKCSDFSRCMAFNQVNTVDLYEFCFTMQEYILKYPNLLVWIEGDFNLPNVDWKSQCIAKITHPVKLCNNTPKFCCRL